MAKAKAKCETLVVGSKVKALIKAKKGKTSGDLLEALSCKVACMLECAVKRAQENKRTTVRPCDL
jgi:hypothetical protein